VAALSVGPELLANLAERDAFVWQLYTWLTDGARGYTLPIAVTDGVTTATLTFGTDSGASDGFDADVDVIAPPPPPTGTFDARFTEVPGSSDGFLQDLRNFEGDEHTWTVHYASGNGGDPISLSWNPALLPSGAFRITDTITGTEFVLDMRTASTLSSADSPLLATGLRIVYSRHVEMTMDLAAEWNLIGLPLAVQDESIETMIPNHVPGTLFSYSGTYENQSTMTPHTGYWVRMPAAESVNMLGEPMAAQKISLAAGWNLIAGLGCTAALIDNQGVLVPGTLFGYADGYHAVSRLEAGRGYWVRAVAPGTVGLTCSSAATQAGKSSPMPAQPEGFGVLAITGPNLNQKLYFGGQLPLNVDVHSFGLPPLGPARQPDVRFGTAVLPADLSPLVAERLVTATALAQAEQGIPIHFNQASGQIQMTVMESPDLEHPVVLRFEAGEVRKVT